MKLYLYIFAIVVATTNLRKLKQTFKMNCIAYKLSIWELFCEIYFILYQRLLCYTLNTMHNRKLYDKQFLLIRHSVECITL